ncbi:MAG: hypothetical protein AAGI09_01710 [Pseudomonadota bacterium]
MKCQRHLAQREVAPLTGVLGLLAIPVLGGIPLMIEPLGTVPLILPNLRAVARPCALVGHCRSYQTCTGRAAACTWYWAASLSLAG